MTHNEISVEGYMLASTLFDMFTDFGVDDKIGSNSIHFPLYCQIKLNAIGF